MKCPACDEPLDRAIDNNSAKNTSTIPCDNCGTFEVTAEALHKMKSIDSFNIQGRALVSHALRKLQAHGMPLLSAGLFESVLKKPLPTPPEQCDNLVLWLGHNLSFPGHEIWIEPKTHRAVLGAVNRLVYQQVIRHLEGLGFIQSSAKESAADKSHTTLSVNGWSHFDSLLKRGSHSRNGFMAMKFGDPQLDSIVEKFFKPAVAKAGFSLQRLDDNQSAGLIDDHLRVALRNAKFIIADLSHANQGVYWEAGFAEGLGKPVIYTCEKSEFERNRTHFDTNHHLTISWDKNCPEMAASKLLDTLRATLPEDARMND